MNKWLVMSDEPLQIESQHASLAEAHDAAIHRARLSGHTKHVMQLMATFKVEITQTAPDEPPPKRKGRGK